MACPRLPEEAPQRHLSHYCDNQQDKQTGRARRRGLSIRTEVTPMSLAATRTALLCAGTSPERRCSLTCLTFACAPVELRPNAAFPFPRVEPRRGFDTLQKGGVPAAPSGTATLLRLSPNHQFYPRPVIPVFRHPRLSWLDGRCVQGPGTYSPRHG